MKIYEISEPDTKRFKLNNVNENNFAIQDQYPVIFAEMITN